MAADASAGQEHDARTAVLLEGILSELSARAALASREQASGSSGSRSMREHDAKAGQ
jgi:hypothetical protein